MSEVVQLSDNGISRVVREGEWVYKYQPKYLTDNEWWALSTLEYTGYVPRFVERVNVSTVKMEYVVTESVTNPRMFSAHYRQVLDVLKCHNLKHGDLTKYAILVSNNTPILIDWAESRTLDDPRPSKRPEGDAYWLRKTMKQLCQK